MVKLHSVILVSFVSVLAACEMLGEKTKSGELLTEEKANAYALYAMMSSNAYLEREGRSFFPIEKLGWAKVSQDGSNIGYSSNSYEGSLKILEKDLGTWGLQYDIWTHPELKETVFSFRGTNSAADWVLGNAIPNILPQIISPHYDVAEQHVVDYLEENPGVTVKVTGHSLGGGIALRLSLHLGVEAVVFDTSPRVFRKYHESDWSNSQRVAIYQKGDFLQAVRMVWPDFNKIVKPQDRIKTEFDFEGKKGHRIDLLAEGLLSCTSTEALIDIANTLPDRVKCYLNA